MKTDAFLVEFRVCNLSKELISDQTLDKYLSNVSFNLLDKTDIEVLKTMAIRLENDNKNSKALNYLLTYESLADTISNRLDLISRNSRIINAEGNAKFIELERLKTDKQISNSAIEHLMREDSLKLDLVRFQKTLIYILCGVIILGIVTLIYINKVSKQRRIANQKLALRSLKSQMNPHFIFNALNSVNSFISENDDRSANNFLTEFSTLMRTVMENSEHDFIPLSKELEILKIYTDLEYFRFKDKFSYELNIDPELNDFDFSIPPMLVQPYIENAIWHRLRYKESPGKLSISFQKDKDILRVCVQDDGIGRKKSAELKTKNQKAHASSALQNIKSRIDLFNELHNMNIKVNVKDLTDELTGTQVTLLIPQLNG